MKVQLLYFPGGVNAFLHEYVTVYVKQVSICKHEMENIIYQYFCKASVLYTSKASTAHFLFQIAQL